MLHVEAVVVAPGAVDVTVTVFVVVAVELEEGVVFHGVATARTENANNA